MITLKGVTKNYRKFKALDNLDLEVGKGSLFGFIGPNGAGKTTTIRILAGVLLPDAGQIEIAGINLRENPEDAKQRTGFIPDRPFLYEKLTGLDFLKFCADIYSVSPADFQKRADRYLTLFSIHEYLNNLVESYSHGMRQRLIIASALIHDPEVIIVDEPMVGLDPAAIKLVKKLFTDLAGEGKTIFMSTHTLEIAQEICDTIAIIHKGKIVAKEDLAGLREESALGEDRAYLEKRFLELTGTAG